MSTELKPYDYFKAPDGQEVFEKFLCVLKPAVITGLSLSVVDTVCLSHPKGYLATLGRYLYVTSPVVFATGTFVAVSNICGSIRKKDDQLNWFIGGVSAGTVLGTYYKSSGIGFVASTLLGLGLLGVKYARLNNFRLYQDDVRICEGGATSHKFGYTLLKERPGNWTTGK